MEAVARATCGARETPRPPAAPAGVSETHLQKGKLATDFLEDIGRLVKETAGHFPEAAEAEDADAA
jgi:hypothetical protein